jgi:DNA-binding MarR family transcriptional regulator
MHAKMGGVTTRDATRIADALGVVLQRRFRVDAYQRLTSGVADGLDGATYPVLSGVARTGPVSAARLGQEIGLDRSIVSRRAARLVSAGLLMTDIAPTDARAVLLSLTPDGERVVRVLRARLADAIDEHLADWSPPDRAQFAALLARFAESGSL